jgi:hypothetical protein
MSSRKDRLRVTRPKEPFRIRKAPTIVVLKEQNIAGQTQIGSLEQHSVAQVVDLDKQKRDNWVILKQSSGQQVQIKEGQARIALLDKQARISQAQIGCPKKQSAAQQAMIVFVQNGMVQHFNSQQACNEAFEQQTNQVVGVNEQAKVHQTNSMNNFESKEA